MDQLGCKVALIIDGGSSHTYTLTFRCYCTVDLQLCHKTVWPPSHFALTFGKSTSLICASFFTLCRLNFFLLCVWFMIRYLALSVVGFSVRLYCVTSMLSVTLTATVTPQQNFLVDKERKTLFPVFGQLVSFLGLAKDWAYCCCWGSCFQNWFITTANVGQTKGSHRSYNRIRKVISGCWWVGKVAEA